MRIQRLNQSSIYQARNRQDGSATIFCKPKPKSDYVSMPSFKGKCTKTTLMGEVGSIISDVYNSIKASYEKSTIRKTIIAPVQKKWSDFAYKAPKFSQVVKGALIVSAGVTAFDAISDKYLK